MREIDPIREPSEALLSSALHRLASGSGRNAPAAVEDSLMDTFRRHHRRRRQVRLAVTGAIAACVLMIAGLVITLHEASVARESRNSQKAAQQTPVARTNPEPQQQRTASAASAATENGGAARAAARPEGGFVALPGYDAAFDDGGFEVVRVQLPASDLRMLGAPVPGDLSDRAIIADFITDLDGTPYAVKLVQ